MLQVIWALVKVPQHTAHNGLAQKVVLICSELALLNVAQFSQ